VTDSEALWDFEDGQTLLDPDDRVGLRQTWISTRADLNVAEQANIRRALTRIGRPSAATILDDLWLKDLHQRMFGEVWDWAGRYRRTLTNLGVEPHLIAPHMRDLVLDAVAWQDEPLLVAVRFHHRLVVIHPFVNGNGRHGRAAATSLSRALDGPTLTWGMHLGEPASARRRYLDALRRADTGDIGPLVEFSTS
jgi:Fic-DOC domain mobile mystery protein B